MRQKSDLPAFIARLGYQFASMNLLEQALRHSSLDVDDDNERLEFLGDRVLGLVVAQALIDKYKTESEGRLSRRLGELVSGRICAEVAKDIGLASVIEIDKSRRGGRKTITPNVLADGCEAVLGAIFLDGGLEAARTIILRLWQPHFEAQIEAPIDPKSELQEWLMQRGLDLPLYEITKRSGPAHAPLFEISVTTAQATATGEGKTRRFAEQQAADACLQILKAAHP
ncbi:MAG: ribonuclease III [Parvibaculales bacterium]